MEFFVCTLDIYQRNKGSVILQTPLATCMECGLQVGMYYLHSLCIRNVETYPFILVMHSRVDA